MQATRGFQALLMRSRLLPGWGRGGAAAPETAESGDPRRVVAAAGCAAPQQGLWKCPLRRAADLRILGQARPRCAAWCAGATAARCPSLCRIRHVRSASWRPYDSHRHPYLAFASSDTEHPQQLVDSAPNVHMHIRCGLTVPSARSRGSSAGGRPLCAAADHSKGMPFRCHGAACSAERMHAPGACARTQGKNLSNSSSRTCQAAKLQSQSITPHESPLFEGVKLRVSPEAGRCPVIPKGCVRTASSAKCAS